MDGDEKQICMHYIFAHYIFILLDRPTLWSRSIDILESMCNMYTYIWGLDRGGALGMIYSRV